jgi:hypothetical protein
LYSVLALSITSCNPGSGGGMQPDDSLLTSVAAIKRLRAAEIKHGVTVEIHGHCSFTDTDFNTSFFQDDDGDGIRYDNTEVASTCVPGDVGTLRGVVSAGSPAPRLTHTQLSMTSRKTRLDSRTLSPSQLHDPKFEYQLVKLTGVIRQSWLEGVGREGLVIQWGKGGCVGAL